MAKILVIIISGKNDTEKAMAGMSFAYNAKVKGYLDDIRIMFFGPSEDLIVSENRDVQDMLKKLMDAGMFMIACKNISDKFQLTAKLSGMGIKVEYVGKIIADYIREGFVPMTF
ncbi:MAG: DsrE family protein [Thermoplasmata archaeon]